MMTERGRSLASASTMSGKRSVRSLPGRLKSRTRSPSLRAMTRKPSCFISCSHASPDGGCDALVGRQGGTKPGGRDMTGYRASVRTASNAPAGGWDLAGGWGVRCRDAKPNPGPWGSRGRRRMGCEGLGGAGTRPPGAKVDVALDLWRSSPAGRVPQPRRNTSPAFSDRVGDGSREEGAQKEPPPPAPLARCGDQERPSRGLGHEEQERHPGRAGEEEPAGGCARKRPSASASCRASPRNDGGAGRSVGTCYGALGPRAVRPPTPPRVGPRPWSPPGCGALRCMTAVEDINA
jgi:hypothetical protein